MLSLATLVCMYVRALGKQINGDGLVSRDFSCAAADLSTRPCEQVR